MTARSSSPPALLTSCRAWCRSPAAAAYTDANERKADHFLAFTSIACTLVCYRRLAK
ncbi:hypothetical protein ACWEWP_33590 [Streptomyces olivaceus]